MMGASELRNQLLEQLAELEDVAAALGLAALAHGDGLTEAQLAEALAGVSMALERLRAVESMVPDEDGPEASGAAADAP
jgi:hypothetical protein